VRYLRHTSPNTVTHSHSDRTCPTQAGSELTGLESSREASALCTDSCSTLGEIEVTCSRQAAYTPVTKSDEGRRSCSLLTDKPHSERADMISGMGMFGNQYCPDISGLTGECE
jgi:hypothetical protein